MTGEYEPCGGCGADHPSKRCIGCLHDFSESNGSIPSPGDKPPTVTAFEAVGSQWRLRVSEEDPRSPWHDGPAPFSVPDGCETEERTVYAITIGGHDGNSTIRKADTGSDLLSANAIAEALEACDWSGSPIGNKAILRTAAHALRCVNRETFEVAEGFEVAPDDGRATGELQPVTPITTVKTVPLLERAIEALRPLSDAVFNDNGDMAVSQPLPSYDDCVQAYFAAKQIRNALETAPAPQVTGREEEILRLKQSIADLTTERDNLANIVASGIDEVAGAALDDAEETIQRLSKNPAPAPQVMGDDA